MAVEGVKRRQGRPGANGPPVPGEAEVLARGMEAFAELGYDRASARELARRLGVSHNFINDRYGSKANFWRAVIDRTLAPDLAERQRLLDADMDDADRIRVVIQHFYRTAATTPLVGRLLFDEFGRESERLDHVFDNYVAPTLLLLAPALQRLAAAGRIPPVPMDVLFFAVMGPVAGLVQLPLAGRLGRAVPADGQARTAEQLADLVVAGLLGRG
ncbi:TetR/AcrR family transcriptional regulator [Kutzneria sp. NPDC052558]|uniref:TetR/AcrR family transcriptional regulator n=1 Tax=Kutzneria sp. NPDC052558 TaxID=3364121 RepID=UPI0037C69AED